MEINIQLHLKILLLIYFFCDDKRFLCIAPFWFYFKTRNWVFKFGKLRVSTASCKLIIVCSLDYLLQKFEFWQIISQICQDTIFNSFLISPCRNNFLYTVYYFSFNYFDLFGNNDFFAKLQGSSHSSSSLMSSISIAFNCTLTILIV